MNFSIIYHPKSKEEFFELWEKFKDTELRPQVRAPKGEDKSDKSEIELEYNRARGQFRFTKNEKLAHKMGVLTRDQIIQQRMDLSPEDAAAVMEEEEALDNVTGL